MPFLRPDNFADLARYQVCIPDSAEWRTQLWGAISSLLEDWDREGISTLTDAEITSEYLAILNSFERCPLTAGVVEMYAGLTIPENTLLCDGEPYNKVDYPELFAAIGNIYGGGGATFKVPDISNHFVYGVGGNESLGDTGGQSSVTLTEQEIPSHQHTTIPATLAPSATGGPVTAWIWNGLPTGQSGFAGGGQSHENRPIYIRLSFIISTGKGC